MTTDMVKADDVPNLQLVLDTCCQGATRQEAQQLIAIASARGLNPLIGDCYFVKRWDSSKKREVWAVQASIDSFRRKAEETGDYGGQDAPELEIDAEGKLVSATVKVYRKSVPGRPFAVGVAYYTEYVQTNKEGKPTRFWQNMPKSQLAKCAEALALRKAFPAILAKVYTPEEMEQAETITADGEIIRHDPPALPDPNKLQEQIQRALGAIEAVKTKEEMDSISARLAKADKAIQSAVMQAYTEKLQQVNGGGQ